MTTTDEMRRLLDERGSDYRFSECTKVFDWRFNGANGEGDACATEVQGGINILARGITPEQAITATLGPETCHAVPIDSFNGEFTEYDHDECSYCGDEWDDLPNYCPNCGRKVVSE